MADYIDKNATEKALTVAAASGRGKDQRTWAKAIRVLHDMPAADVAPVVRSRWRYCGFLQECQTCGGIYSVHGGNSGTSWNFCPNCGAKMDGGVHR